MTRVVDAGQAAGEHGLEVHVRGCGAQGTWPARLERCGERAEIAKGRRGSRRQDDAAEDRPETAGIALERQHACRPSRRRAEGDDLDVRRHLILQRPARATHQHLDRVPARRQGARKRQHGLLDPAALEVVEVEGESSAPRPRAPLSAHAQLTHPGSAGARSLPARSLRVSRASVNRGRPEPKADICRVCNRLHPHQRQALHRRAGGTTFDAPQLAPRRPVRRADPAYQRSPLLATAPRPAVSAPGRRPPLPSVTPLRVMRPEPIGCAGRAAVGRSGRGCARRAGGAAPARHGRCAGTERPGRERRANSPPMVK